jgi:hypothetical protein
VYSHPVLGEVGPLEVLLLVDLVVIEVLDTGASAEVREGVQPEVELREVAVLAGPQAPTIWRIGVML